MSAPDQPVFALLRGPRRIEIAPDELGIDFRKARPTSCVKARSAFQSRCVVMIIKKCRRCAGLLAMAADRNIVAPLLFLS